MEAVVVVTEHVVVDWLDFIWLEAPRDTWVDEENTGGLNSASMIASVSFTVSTRVLVGLRFVGVVG